ncbi:DUF1254 domain-containing protein [Flavobacterium sp. LHD-80]|uniref:DUF1254 domain-containing protein n=1 Tax=Flavobacterium sp. LHD-80 TaxID=3071411 RepID=UPI0027E1E6E3|nr:DUF1254 domain-containing protein [Flavobacterium sp. LHD-80]MDQ6473095.1 DUF1254 domain-containing protein [Flavobacterium sp. LHD-80]
MKIMIYKGILLSAIICFFGCKKEQNEVENSKESTEQTNDLGLSPEAFEAYKTTVKAYTWGYPLMVVGITADEVTMVPKPMPNGHAPINQMGNVAKLMTAADTDVVSSNADTMYSNAFLDLSSGAAILSVPETKGRYYSMMFSDAYTNIFDYVGSRTTGTKAGKYLVVGPDWKGETPKGIIKVIKSPTNLVWLIGRTLVDGVSDVPNVHAIQKGYTITMIPVKSEIKPWKERLGLVTPKPMAPPVTMLNNMDWRTYFDWLGKLMKENPVTGNEKTYTEEFKSIGLTFENGFDTSKITPEQQKGIEKGIADALEIMKKRAAEKMGTDHEGWSYDLNAGKWGEDYLVRAAIALRSVGQNTAQEALYINSVLDKEGKVLDASQNNYSVTFPKGELPPADAFWSITMYNDQNFFVPNPIHRLAIGNRTKEMKPNTDGSLTIYIQKEEPKGKTGNWLPAPNGKFRVSLRIYVPNNKILNGGKWTPPGIVKTK